MWLNQDYITGGKLYSVSLSENITWPISTARCRKFIGGITFISLDTNFTQLKDKFNGKNLSDLSDKPDCLIEKQR
jgi:hypothetical protein